MGRGEGGRGRKQGRSSIRFRGSEMVANKEPVCREYTVNLHKEMHGISFKRRAPRAIKVIKAFAKKQMGTSDVRLDQNLNKEVWSKGVKSVPNRVRIQIRRVRNEDEDAKEEMYSHVTVAEVPETGFKGLGTSKVDL